ncbi:MAG: hypothetical protein FWG89_08010 [Treponema sp.]|nr:hypothetical protein [Treponema sp.]
MKNKLFFVFTLIIITGMVFVTTGCVSTETAGVRFFNYGDFGEQVRTPAKDFETVGLVFADAEFEVSSRGRGSVDGQIFTYQALLKEAQRLNADAIINVIIDRRVMTSSSTQGSTRTETFYGSALAIRYTATLRESGSVVSGSTTTTTDRVYMNSGVTGGQIGGGGSVTQESGGLGGLFGGR